MLRNQLNELEVIPTSPQSNSVIVRSGRAIVGNAPDNAIGVTVDPDTTLQMPAPSSRARIDLVGVWMQNTDTISLSDIGFVQGTPGGGVPNPNPTYAQDANQWFLTLAQVSRGANDNTVSAGDITMLSSRFAATAGVTTEIIVRTDNNEFRQGAYGDDDIVLIGAFVKDGPFFETIMLRFGDMPTSGGYSIGLSASNTYYIAVWRSGTELRLDPKSNTPTTARRPISFSFAKLS